MPGGSVRTTAPVDFDGAELGVASPAGETTDAKAQRPAAANADDDDEMAEETSTMEMPSEQLADEVAAALLVPRASTATEVDLPQAPKAIRR